MPEVNRDLLERVMTKIKDDPDHHCQGSWALKTSWCGTVACFAGWAVMLEGWQPIFDLNSLVAVDAEKDGQTEDICDLAQDLLGIADGDVTILFNGNNSREGLELMVKDLLNGDRLADRWTYQAGWPPQRQEEDG